MSAPFGKSDPVGAGFAADTDGHDDRKVRRWVVGALVVVLLVSIGVALWSARPHDARPDLQLRGTIAPVYVPPAGPDEQTFAILEQPAGGRP